MSTKKPSQSFSQRAPCNREITIKPSNCSPAVEPHDQRSIAGKYFYTLPIALLDLVIAEVGNNRFDASLIELERSLSAPLGNHSSHVGYWQNSPITFTGLSLRNSQVATQRHDGPLPIEEHLQIGSHLLYYRQLHYPMLQRDFRSYAGWLSTNKQFLDEHDSLITRNLDVIRKWGVGYKRSPIGVRLFENDEQDPDRDPAWISYVSSKMRFLCRWRISSLPGPYLPVPLNCESNDQPPEFPLFMLWEMGAIVFLPDIMPLPSRDQLRTWIHKIRARTTDVEHLASWFKIARSGNTAKNKLEKLARIFELQHYWRLLQNRHASALVTKTGKLEIAFAEWFKVSVNTIHQDRIIIKKRLGRDWQHRRSPI